MPFVQIIRRIPLWRGLMKPDSVGDLCYLFYQQMMITWNAEPRWTTIHYMVRGLPWQIVKRWATARNRFNILDYTVAAVLAFQEWYLQHGHEYEIEKRIENGDIY